MPTFFGSPEQPYLKSDQKALEEKYTPAQLQSIDASERHITSSDLQRAKSRDDPWSLDYYDDMNEILPGADKPIRAPYTNTDASSRLKTDDELTEDLANFVLNLPDNLPDDHDAWQNFTLQHRLTVGKEEAELNPRSAVTPDLLPLPQPRDRSDADDEEKGKRKVDDSAFIRLMQMTGLSWADILNLRVKTIIYRRVANQTRLGKISRPYFLSVAGNENGLVGIGEAKADEPEDARLQSQYRAIKNMQPILRYEQRTTFGDVNAKVSGTELELFARPPGMSN